MRIDTYFYSGRVGTVPVSRIWEAEAETNVSEIYQMIIKEVPERVGRPNTTMHLKQFNKV